MYGELAATHIAGFEQDFGNGIETSERKTKLSGKSLKWEMYAYKLVDPEYPKSVDPADPISLGGVK